MSNSQKPKKSHGASRVPVISLSPAVIADLLSYLEKVERNEFALLNSLEAMDAPLTVVNGAVGSDGVLTRLGRVPRGVPDKAGKAARILTQANRQALEVDLALQDLRGCIESVVSPGGSSHRGAAVRMTEITEVRELESYKDGRTVYTDFEIDGVKCPLPAALASLFKELLADIDPTTSGLIGFKSERWLQRELDITSDALDGRLHRLKVRMAENGFSKSLVENSRRGEGWRLRVLRP